MWIVEGSQNFEIESAFSKGLYYFLTETEKNTVSKSRIIFWARLEIFIYFCYFQLCERAYLQSHIKNVI